MSSRGLRLGKLRGDKQAVNRGAATGFAFWGPRVVPQSHDVAVGAETGDAVGTRHLHHVGPQDEGRLGDVVFVDAGLRGHGQHLGLLLRAQHGELAVLALL